MKQKKSTIVLLPPDEYWDKKLNICHKTEFIRYRKLCSKLSKKDHKQLDGLYFITYKDWEMYFLNKLSILNTNELLEYSHYLENKSRLESSNNILTNNIVLPFFLTIMAPITNELIRSYINVANPDTNSVYQSLISTIHMIICAIAWLPTIRSMAKSSIEETLHKYFFDDIKSLAISLYENGIPNATK